MVYFSHKMTFLTTYICSLHIYAINAHLHMYIPYNYININNFCVADPIVAVEVTAAVDPTIYQPLVLQCTATIVRGITSTVDIIWTTGNTQVRRVNNVTASSNINSSSIYNDSFIIPSLKISDARNVYQCQVLINSVLPTATTADFIISIPGMYVCTTTHVRILYLHGWIALPIESNKVVYMHTYIHMHQHNNEQITICLYESKTLNVNNECLFAVHTYSCICMYVCIHYYYMYKSYYYYYV